MLHFFADSFVGAVLFRTGPGSYSDTSGEWTPGTVEGVTTPNPDPDEDPIFTPGIPIRIIPPQPVRENDLGPLPEGEAVSNYRKTWSEPLLRTRIGDNDADVVRYAGRDYKVFQVDDRDVDGAFYRVIMREVLP